MNTKKKFTFTYVSKEGIVKRFYSDYYTQGDLKIISEMFKKFLEISNGCENWDVFDLNKELSNITFSLSNYDNYLDESLELVNDYKGIWEKGDIQIKKDIQNILFSNQIEYDPKKMSYRTPKENLVMSMLTGNRDKIKARKRGQKPTNSRIVLKVGIEPTRPKSLDFESSASTNSAT